MNKDIIAFIGTGVMGKGMINNLAKTYTLHVYNRTLSKAKALESDNILCFESIEETIKDASIICTMVGYPSDVKEVYDVIFNSNTRAHLAIDFTTSSPDLALNLYKTAKAKGLSLLDAPVSGGDIGATNGTLSIMVGGDKESFDQATPLFNCIGKTITYCGNAGAGQHIKAINQILVAANLAGVCEALTYASDHNIDFDTMMNCVANGAAGSWQLVNNGPKAYNHDYAPGFFMKHFLKDLNIALDNSSTNLPVTNTVKSMVENLCNNGFENDGTQALIEYYKNNH